MLSKRMLLALFITAVGLVLLISSVAAAPSLTPIQQLGKSIFFDTNLSLNNNQSCAACHAPESGWTGPDAAINAHGAVYEGSIPGAFGDRKPPSSAYATQSPILHLTKKGLFVGGNFWDGRATGEILGSPAAEQAKGPFLNPKEQALPNAAALVAKVCAAAVIAPLWAVSDAAAHTRLTSAGRSPRDSRWLRPSGRSRRRRRSSCRPRSVRHRTVARRAPGDCRSRRAPRR